MFPYLPYVKIELAHFRVDTQILQHSRIGGNVSCFEAIFLNYPVRPLNLYFLPLKHVYNVAYFNT